MSSLPFSDSFEYICYGSTDIINSFTLTLRGLILDVYRRQILTTKVDPRAVKVESFKYHIWIVFLKVVYEHLEAIFGIVLFFIFKVKNLEAAFPEAWICLCISKK